MRGWVSWVVFGGLGVLLVALGLGEAIFAAGLVLLLVVGGAALAVNWSQRRDGTLALAVLRWRLWVRARLRRR